MQITNFLAAAAAMVPMAAAHGVSRMPGTVFGTRGADRPGRCANTVPPAQIYQQMSDLATADKTYSRIQSVEDGVSKCKRAIKVKTWIHSAVSETAPDTYLNTAAMQKQFDVLNAAYVDHDVIFVKEGFTRTVSTSTSNFTYVDAADGSIGGSPNPDVEAYWKQYRTGDYQTLHIWLYETMGDGGLLGIATFPDINKKEADKWLDGVHAAGDSLPGGSLSAFNLGATVTHEVGHWLGLFHVFNDDRTCTLDNGDLVDDTPPQSEATSGCPADNTQDSCTAPGFDSIHNYMDYSDDVCLTEFTEGQEARIHNVWTNVRNAIPW
ncbi:Pregnancy-associated plasma protein-A [Microdochium nivale]|nr:Pregnancy-associated plasma protein-A [Microdochium nivale]